MSTLMEDIATNRLKMSKIWTLLEKLATLNSSQKSLKEFRHLKLTMSQERAKRQIRVVLSRSQTRKVKIQILNQKVKIQIPRVQKVQNLKVIANQRNHHRLDYKKTII